MDKLDKWFNALEKWISMFYRENIRDTLSKLPSILFFIFILYWLKEPIKSYFDLLIVEKFLSRALQYPLQPVSFAIFVGLWLYSTSYILLKIQKNKFKVNLYILFILFFVVSVYSMERLSWNNYDHLTLFSDLAFTSVFSFLDPIFLTFGLFWALLVINSNKWNLPKTERKSWIVRDDHQKKGKDDKFNWDDEIQNFANLVKEAHKQSNNYNSSYVIGIIGGWGDGKTTFMELAKEKFENDAIIVGFNPWMTSTTSNLIEDFFVTLDYKISNYIITNNTITKYGKALSKINFSENFISNFKDLIFQEAPLQERFDQVSKLVAKLDKEVYVFIDDLDRLDSSEIFEVLRLVRNTANFPNLIFIIAYDRNYIIKALGNLKIPNSSKYLEKIINLEIPLPLIKNQVVTSQLVKLLNEKIDEVFTHQIIERNAFENQIRKIVLDWPDLFGNDKPKYQLGLVISQLILNLRDRNRFSNSFLFSLTNHYSEIYLPDLFILELIKLFNPDLFIRLYKKDYLIIQNEYGIRSYELFESQEINKLAFVPPYKISEILKKHSINPIENQLVSELFKLPLKEDFNNKFALAYYENFDYYFTKVLDVEQISFNEIENQIKEGESNTNEEILKFFTDAIEEGKGESIFEKLQFDYSINSKVEFENYLTILMVLIEGENFEIINNIFLRKVINRDFGFFPKDKYSEEIFILIKEKAISPFLGISITIRNLITSHIYNKPEEDKLREKIPSKIFLLDTNLYFLKRYFGEVDKSKWKYELYMGLYYNCIDNIENQSREIKISIGACEFLKEKLIGDKSLFSDYLDHFFRYTGIIYSVEQLNSYEIGPEPFFEQIFGSQELFIEELSKIKSKTSTEIQRFFKKKKATNKITLKDINGTIELHVNLNKKQKP